MKTVLILAIVACVAAVAYGDLVCGSDFCKKNPCTNTVTPNSCKKDAQYRPNHAGKCACCPACVTLLPENANCKTYSKELGETPNAVCADPMKCVGGKCVKITPRS
ncbi:hypothetical protein O0L34_g7196 [Tuta absoluta]|nr:hypothetical protein O0L34_g7196 [Tuta absoluta]